MEKGQSSSLNGLPFDLWVDILLLLPLGDIISVRLVCRTLYTASRSRTILFRWAQRTLKSYGVHPGSLSLAALQHLPDDQLEQVIARPFALERFLTSSTDPVQALEQASYSRGLRIHKLPSGSDVDWQGFTLLPGGRWLFGLNRDQLVCFDLAALPTNGTLQPAASIDVHPGPSVSGGRVNTIEWEMGDTMSAHESAVMFICGDYRLNGTEIHVAHVNIVTFAVRDNEVELVSQNRMRFPNTAWVTSMREDQVAFSVGGIWLGVWDWRRDRIAIFKDSLQAPQYARFAHCNSFAKQICASGKLWSVNSPFVWMNPFLTGSLRLYELPPLSHVVNRSLPLDDPDAFIAQYRVEPDPFGRSLPVKSDHANVFCRLPYGPQSILDDEPEVLLATHGYHRRPGERTESQLKSLHLDRLWPQQLTDPHALRRTPLLECPIDEGRKLSWFPGSTLHFPRSTSFTWFIERSLWIMTCTTPYYPSSRSSPRHAEGEQPRPAVWRKFFDPFAHDRMDEEEPHRQRNGRTYALCGYTGRWVMVSPDWRRVAILDPDLRAFLPGRE